ncbi:MAG: hypothetical protein ABSF92_12740 [Candidatus Acidiferrales bacterium]|jgi:hypothetical protein
MIFRNRLKDPGAMMSIGMICLVIALLLPRVLHPTAHFGPDFMDGVQGGLFGISIGMNLWSARLAARQRRCGGS